MATGTERSKALHNFTFPVGLRWGNQKFLRCIKVDSDGKFIANDSDSSDHHQQSIDQRRTTSDGERNRDSSASKLLPSGSSHMGSAPPPVSDVGFSETVKLDDVQTPADNKSKDATFEDTREDGAAYVYSHPPVPQRPAVMSGEGETKRPWNLRKRLAVCKTPVIFDANGGKTLMADGATDEFSRLRSGGNAAAIWGEKLTRLKLSVALSKREIEEDFLGFTGHKPARRPKKRAKIVQRELDTLFPGLSLKEITADLYKVSEASQ